MTSNKNRVGGRTVRNRLTYLWEDRGVAGQCKTAVSLHGHTNHSREGLYFIAEFASRYAPLRWALSQLDKRAQRESAITLDFWKAYWTPPLAPLEAFTLERRQIEEDLGMKSLISLTDHDNIEAPLLLRVIPEARRIPVSLEWSINFEDTILHLGVHNLPTMEAVSWVARLNAHTAQPNPSELRDLLSSLSRIPQVLLVFNHPLWDLPNIGKENHRRAVRNFLAQANPFLHAFELGGLRNWKENQEVIALAKAYGHSVIAGGDRHGCEPSALLNLTDASTFSEFVEEVRQGNSHVLAMPQYADSTSFRVFHALLDIIRTYPDHPMGSREWDERVYHPDESGATRPLAMLWEGPPSFVKLIFQALRAGETAPMRATLRRALNRDLQVPRLEFEDGQEAPS
jgi:hypothetical protein